MEDGFKIRPTHFQPEYSIEENTILICVSSLSTNIAVWILNEMNNDFDAFQHKNTNIYAIF